MSFSGEMNKNFSNIKTKYDLIAFCYHYLENNIVNESNFLGAYIEKSNNAKMINPNFDLLNHMAFQLKLIMDKSTGTFSPLHKSGPVFTLITDTEKKLKKYGIPSLNNATIPFFMLLGLDLYFQDCIYETCKTSPLNDYLNKKYLVYINNKMSILDSVRENKNYAATIKNKEIRNCFKHMLIFKRSEIPRMYGIPKLVSLFKNEEHLEYIVQSKQIKIALIPTTKEKWIGFPHQEGGLFAVEYDTRKTQIMKNRVLELLKWAIKCKVNIIVFPEYICSEEIQLEICNYLIKLNRTEPEKLKNLLFVVAGSGWTKDSNNVSCLYSYDGNLLGKVYKYSAYDNDINGEPYVENLQNPGKEITLIKIPGLGVFQTEICRNVSECEFSLKLAKVFDSQFLLIPAWSSSINRGFQKQTDAIVSQNYRTCSAMCNCCAAVPNEDGFREDIGIITVPQKKGAVVEGRYRYTRRAQNICDQCCEKQCFFEVCYDFNQKGKYDVGTSIRFRKK